MKRETNPNVSRSEYSSSLSLVHFLKESKSIAYISWKDDDGYHVRNLGERTIEIETAIEIAKTAMMNSHLPDKTGVIATFPDGRYIPIPYRFQHRKWAQGIYKKNRSITPLKGGRL